MDDIRLIPTALPITLLLASLAGGCAVALAPEASESPDTPDSPESNPATGKADVFGEYSIEYPNIQDPTILRWVRATAMMVDMPWGDRRPSWLPTLFSLPDIVSTSA